MLGAHTHTHTHTHTQTDRPNYRNPRCACTPRVNKKKKMMTKTQFAEFLYMKQTGLLATLGYFLGRRPLQKLGKLP